MSFADGSLLKAMVDCPCGCGAYGTPDRRTGHPKRCVDSCPTCARPKKTASMDRIPPAVRRQVMARAGGYCEARVEGVCTGQPEHLHHKRLRSQGGGHTAANLIAVCEEDHRWIHDHPDAAISLGLLARTEFEPESSAVTKVEKVQR